MAPIATAPGQPVPSVAPAQPGDARDVPAGPPPSARRTPLLACTLETLRPAARVAGVEVLILSDQSPLDDVLANLDTNARGFDPAAPPTTREEAIAFRAELRTNRALTATLDGVPVSAGMFTPPIDGIAELVGIATLARYRGRGIGQCSPASSHGLPSTTAWIWRSSARTTRRPTVSTGALAFRSSLR